MSGYSIKRKSVLEATVEVQISAILNERDAVQVGSPMPQEGLWNEVVKVPFEQAASGPNVSDESLKFSSIHYSTQPVKNRSEGSAEETGSQSTDTQVAVLSFAFEAEEKPQTYFWITLVFSEKSEIVGGSW